MEVDWLPPLVTPHTVASRPPPPSPIQRKRHAEILEDRDQPLAKRLERLTIRPGSIVFINNHPVPAPKENPTPLSSRRNLSSSDSMQLDHPDHVVYISSIDDELASEDEREADEYYFDAAGVKRKKIFFIPDIERELGRIPESVLKSRSGGSVEAAGKELVLYSAPKALTETGEGNGSVRRAIVESRRRLREKQARELEEVGQANGGELPDSGDADSLNGADFGVAGRQLQQRQQQQQQQQYRQQRQQQQQRQQLQQFQPFAANASAFNGILAANGFASYGHMDSEVEMDDVQVDEMDIE